MCLWLRWRTVGKNKKKPMEDNGDRRRSNRRRTCSLVDLVLDFALQLQVSRPAAGGDVAPPVLKLDMGAFCVPKEGPHPRGDDAHFVNRALNAFAVADGVGGWTNEGVDAGEFARQLMSFCEAELEAAYSCRGDVGNVLEGVLDRALARTTARGTSTACLAMVDGQVLRAVNLGDSGFLVLRGDNVVYHSDPQQSGFNRRPYQVGGVDNGDSPALADKIAVPIEAGDIIVAGTDGLFDNLFDEQIVGILTSAKADGYGAPEQMAGVLAWATVEAYNIARETPFAEACRKANIPWRGGKPDDVTVVVARVR